MVESWHSCSTWETTQECFLVGADRCNLVCLPTERHAAMQFGSLAAMHCARVYFTRNGPATVL